jgi:hypothetical protein
MGEMKAEYRNLFRELEGKRSLGRPWRGWEGIRTDLREIEWEGLDWMHLSQDRNQGRGVVDTVMNLCIP